MATSPLISRTSEMAMAIVSMRSSRRSFSSCWALRNEASESGVRHSRSGNSVSGLADPSVGKMQSPVQKLARLRFRKGESAHGSGLAKTLEASAARAARLQIRSILLSMVAQPVCASGERCNCFLRRICTLCVLCGDNTTNGGAQIGKNGIFRVLLAGDDKSGGGWIIELGRRPKEKPPAAGRCRRWRGW